MTLWRRTIVSTVWSFAANLFSIALLLVRSILLARWLPVELFGVYGFAVAATTITLPLVHFGMDSAFLHRSLETADETHTTAVYFTLKLLMSTIWMFCLVVGAFWLAQGESRLALIVLTLANGGTLLADSARVMLVRRVVHRRLSLITFIHTTLATIVALALAWYGAMLWALLSVEIVGAIVGLFMLYVWRPVWRPHLAWSPDIVRYFFSFGGRTLGSGLLSTAIDKVDDLWVGFYLGDTALGFYNRAFAFSRYPRLLLADPVTNVVAGSYAELKENRSAMSQLFFGVNALLLRSSFLIAGALALVAPELIRLVLGDKWLPMVDIFRLMLVYTLLDPIRKTIGYIFIAVGRPEQLAQIRAAQFVLLAVLLYALGWALGLPGIALAVNIVVVVGIVVALYAVRAYVDVSYGQLFFYPVVGLSVGIAGVLFIDSYLVSVAMADIPRILLKSAAFTLVYSAVLLTFERRQTGQMLSLLRHTFSWKR